MNFIKKNYRVQSTFKLIIGCNEFLICDYLMLNITENSKIYYPFCRMKFLIFNFQLFYLSMLITIKSKPGRQNFKIN